MTMTKATAVECFKFRQTNTDGQTNKCLCVCFFLCEGVCARAFYHLTYAKFVRHVRCGVYVICNLFYGCWQIAAQTISTFTRHTHIYITRRTYCLARNLLLLLLLFVMRYSIRLLTTTHKQNKNTFFSLLMAFINRW